MKQCALCKQLKRVTDFNKKSRSKDGLQPQCRICGRAKSRAYYKDNRDIHIINIYKRRVENINILQSFIIDYLKNHPCVDCGLSNILVLEFDHVRGIKSNNISQMIHHNVSLNTLKKEIEKCDVRCANCHKMKTAKTFKHFKYQNSL